MTGERTKAAEKRARLRAALASATLQRFVGAMTPLVALEIERLGFEGVYVSGAVTAADLGLPDLGLTTREQVIRRGRQMARVTNLPTIIDLDTGFGSLDELRRAVEEAEEAGLAGCHIEDQVERKRCGHLEGKHLVSCEEMVARLQAAVAARRDANFLIIARTDALASEGLSGTLARAEAYVEAGADVIFPEAITNLPYLATFPVRIEVPLLFNATEFGKSPAVSVEQLQQLGYALVIYPVTTLRLAMKAITDGLVELRDRGAQAGLLGRMQTREQLQSLLRYDDYEEAD